LRRYLPDGNKLTGVRALTTGFSNETYRLEGLDQILRLPPAAGAMLSGHDVIGQANIYQALGAMENAPPVPPIMAICEDTSVLGVPFFVMGRVPGESIDDVKMNDWFVDGSDEFRRQICHDWIAAFARLSDIQPLSVLGPVVTPEEDMRVWREFTHQANCPALVALFDRLLAVPAPLSGPSALVHGDPKLANLMWQDGKITAMLDWEMALNGEPLANLGYMLFLFESEYHSAARAPKLPGMLSRAEVIALWSQVSGRSTEGLLWHETAQIGKIAAIIAEGVNMAETGRSDDPRLELFKQNIGYYIGVMERMLDGMSA